MSYIRVLLSIAIATGIVLLPVQALAQEYSCGAYGEGDYGVGNCGTGDLSDTGINVWLLRALAALLLLAAVALIYYALRKRKQRRQQEPIS